MVARPSSESHTVDVCTHCALRPRGLPIVCLLLEHARLDHKRSLCREPRHLPLALHGLLGVYTDHPIEGSPHGGSAALGSLLLEAPERLRVA
jgi:hypothetical protein